MESPLVWIFGPFEFDAAAFRLRRGDRVVPLEPKAMDVLGLLLERSPGVVEKSEIFAVVWKDVAVTDNALTRVVAQLRKALDDDARHPTYIETVATRGYRLAVPVVRGMPSRTARSAPAVRTRFAVGVAAVILLVGAALFWLARPAGGLLNAAAEGAWAGPDVSQTALLRPAQFTTGSGYDGMLAFSPDGTSVAYSSDRSGAFEIYVQGLAGGSTALALTANGRQNVQPSWSPDGQFIAYHEAAGGGIWVIPSRGGTARRVAESGSRPAWSPSGSAVAFQSFSGTDLTLAATPTSASIIRIVDVTSGAMHDVTHSGTPSGPHVAPEWSPDGRLYFVETPSPFTGTQDTASEQIWSVEPDGRDLRREASSSRVAEEYALDPDARGAWMPGRSVTGLWWQPLAAGGRLADARPTGMPALGSPRQPALSADGSRLGWTALTSRSSLWEVPLSGAPGIARPLDLGDGIRATGAAAASDGRLTYSAAIRGNAPQIWVRTPDGRSRQVTVDRGDHFRPFWLAGDRDVAYFATHGPVQGVHSVDVTTGQERELFRADELPFPPGARLHPLASLNVIPDLRLSRVAVTLQQEGVPQIWVVGLENRRPAGTAHQVTFDRDGGSFPHWSPDGRWLAYQCADGDHTNLCVVDAEGRQHRQLTQSPGQHFVGGWKDGEHVFAAARRHAVWNVIEVSLRTGGVRPVTSFTDARSFVRYPQWDAAGKRILFERSETRANIWVVELTKTAAY